MRRYDRPRTGGTRKKIALYGGVSEAAVVSAVDADDIYGLPLMFEAEGFATAVCRRLGLTTGAPDLTPWRELVERIGAP